MTHDIGLADRFEAHRPHLRQVALRLLGSEAAAGDAVQEAWVRLSRAEATDIDNLGGWLTTVVGRVCLDTLRARRSRPEDPFDDEVAEAAFAADAADPEAEVVLADAVGVALVTVLDTLAPGERVAFVLHDLFQLPFEDVARVLRRTPVAARQLASRGRRKVRTAPRAGASDRTRRETLVAAFLAASRQGDFAGLLAVLDPDVVLRADAAGVGMGAAPEVRGAQAVAATFKGRALGAELALVDGLAQLAWAVGGQLRVAFLFDVTDDRVTGIELVADPDRLSRLHVTPAGGARGRV